MNKTKIISISVQLTKTLQIARSRGDVMQLQSDDSFSKFVILSKPKG